MPKISQKNIFLISGVAIFLVIATLFAFYFTSQNNSKSEVQNSQSSQNSLSNSSLVISNSISDSISNENSSQTSAFTNSSNPTNSTQNSNPNSQFSNNSQNNSSSNSNINSSQSYKISSSNLNLQSYKNEFLPNLSIKYDNSWKMETTTKKSDFYENIMIREVVLTKNKSEIKFVLRPIIPIGCGENDTNPLLVKLGDFNRYKTEENPYNEKSEVNSYYYSKRSSCDLNNAIKSNINSKNIKLANDVKYYRDFMSSETVDFFTNIELESDNLAEIAEADEIIKNSILE